MKSLPKPPIHPYLYAQAILTASYRDGCLSPHVNLTKASAQGYCEESLHLWDHDSEDILTPKGLYEDCRETPYPSLLKGLKQDPLRTPQFC